MGGSGRQNSSGGWINTRYDLSLGALKGKVVILDFWTFCCINCLHVLAERRPLEESFGDDLVVKASTPRSSSATTRRSCAPSPAATCATPCSTTRIAPPLDGSGEDLVVADTNNHRLVRVGLDGEVRPFEVRGLLPPVLSPKRVPFPSSSRRSSWQVRWS